MHKNFYYSKNLFIFIVYYKTLKTKNMETFKFRAETLIDVELLNLMHIGNFKITEFKGWPDVEVEFDSELSKTKIKNLMKKIPNGHVMVGTIEQIQKYTGIRK